MKLRRYVVTTIAFVLALFLFTGTTLALQLGDRNLSLNSRGEDVRELQRELSTLNYNVGPIDGSFGPLTRAAVVRFQGDNGVPTTGLFGPLSFSALQRVKANSGTTYVVQRGDILFFIAQKYGVTTDALSRANNITNPNMIYVGQVLTIPGQSASNVNPVPSQSTRAALTPWAQVHGLFARGSNATVIDVQTGLSFTVRRFGGSNHADVEPLTLADRNTMYQIYGNQWSWARRPVVVIINGQRHAGSMNGMPHAGQSITNNNFDGHFCIHFLDSRTHGTNSVDAAHQNAVRQAVGK